MDQSSAAEGELEMNRRSVPAERSPALCTATVLLCKIQKKVEGQLSTLAANPANVEHVRALNSLGVTKNRISTRPVPGLLEMRVSVSPKEIETSDVSAPSLEILVKLGLEAVQWTRAEMQRCAGNEPQICSS